MVTPVELDAPRRYVVCATIGEVCDHRRWRLCALHVRTTHVHAVVCAPHTPERVMNDFKAYATRRMRDLFNSNGRFVKTVRKRTPYNPAFLNPADLASLGLERAPGLHDPEDHIALLCETMAALCDGRLGHGPDESAFFFERHLKPWAARFFADLEMAKAAKFYQHIGRIGRLFITIETQAFAFEA